MVAAMAANHAIAATNVDQEIKFLTGATTHFVDQGKGIVESNLQLFKQAGMLSPRDEITWRFCEVEKGVIKIPQAYSDFIDNAVSKDLEPFTILCYSNNLYDDQDYPRSDEAVEAYARYCESMVRLYKGKCRFYQVWNEWDGGTGMPGKYRKSGDVESYIKLLKVVYPRIKAIDPQAIVIGTSVCSGNYNWFRKMVEQGAMQHCDGLAFHTYNYPTGTPEEWLRRMGNVRSFLRRHNDGKDFPLYITEMGWPTQLNDRGVTPERSAKYLARLYLLARTMPFIKGIWWYDFQDDGWNAQYAEHNFGMIKSDLTPKPSYYVMKSIARLVSTADFVGRVDVGDSNIWILQFKYAHGPDALAMWSAHPDDDWQVCIRKNNPGDKTVAFYHAGRTKVQTPWGARSWGDLTSQRHLAPLRPDELEFSLRGLPLVIEGDLKGIELVGVKRRDRKEQQFFNRPVRTPDKFARALARDDDADDPRTQIDEYKEWHGKRQGQDDIDASFAIRYDEDSLYVNVHVVDDVFFQDNISAEYAWQADGLQMAFQYPDSTGDAKARTEIDVAKTVNGPEAFVRHIQRGELKQYIKPEDVKITRDGKLTIYDLRVKWVEMGFPKLKQGSILKFSILVNDNDGSGRKGYLHWGQGIGSSKDPELYNLLLLD